jgi:hypothetical protein
VPEVLTDPVVRVSDAIGAVEAACDAAEANPSTDVRDAATDRITAAAWHPAPDVGPDDLVVPREAVAVARRAYAHDFGQGWNAAESLRAIVTLTRVLGGLIPGDYVLVSDEVHGLGSASAPSDVWSPLPGFARVRVVDVTADGLARIRRPDGGETSTIAANHLVWCL